MSNNMINFFSKQKEENNEEAVFIEEEINEIVEDDEYDDDEKSSSSSKNKINKALEKKEKKRLQKEKRRAEKDKKKKSKSRNSKDKSGEDGNEETTSKKPKKRKGEKTPSIMQSMLGKIDLICPDGFSEYESFMRVGEDRYSISAWLDIWPRKLYTGIMEKLYSGGDIDTRIIIKRGTDKEDAELLTKRLRQLQTMQHFAEKNVDEKRKREIATEIRDINSLLDGLSQGSDYLYRVWVGSTISGRTPKEARQVYKSIKKYFATKGALNSQKARMRVAYGRQSEYYRKIMPIVTQDFPHYYKRGILPKLIGPATEPLALGIESEEFRTMNLSGACALNFFNNPEFAYVGGIPLGRNVHSNSTIFLDLFMGPPLANNYNLGIFGEPGSGKSATAKVILERMYGIRHTQAVCIDPNGELRGLANRIPHSVRILFDDSFPYTINPFVVYPEWFEDMEGNKFQAIPLGVKINTLNELYNVIHISLYGEPMSPRKMSILDKATTRLYAEKGITVHPDSIYLEDTYEGGEFVQNRLKHFPTFTELYLMMAELFYNIYPEEVQDLKLFLSAVMGGKEKLDKQPNKAEIELKIKKGLEKGFITHDDIIQDIYAGGSIKFFDGQTDIETKINNSISDSEDKELISLYDSPLVAFDMKNIRDNTRLLPIAMFVAIDFIRETFLKKSVLQQKIVFIDEAWRMLRKTAAFSAPFLEVLIREARKFNTSVILASQNFQDFYLGGDIGRSIFQNIPMVLLMNQSEATVDKICEVFHLDDGIRKILLGLKESPGRGVFKTPNALVEIKVEISDEEWEFTDTNPNSGRNSEWAS